MRGNALGAKRPLYSIMTADETAVFLFQEAP